MCLQLIRAILVMAVGDLALFIYAPEMCSMWFTVH